MSKSSSRSAASKQGASKTSNAIRRAISNAKSAVKKTNLIAPVEGGGKK